MLYHQSVIYISTYTVLVYRTRWTILMIVVLAYSIYTRNKTKLATLLFHLFHQFHYHITSRMHIYIPPSQIPYLTSVFFELLWYSWYIYISLILTQIRRDITSSRKIHSVTICFQLQFFFAIYINDQKFVTLSKSFELSHRQHTTLSYIYDQATFGLQIDQCI